MFLGLLAVLAPNPPLPGCVEPHPFAQRLEVLLRKKLLWCLRHAKAAGGVAVAMAAIAPWIVEDFQCWV